MTQTERISQMEQHLDQATHAVQLLTAALTQYAAAQPALQALSAYYGSPDWKQDFADDEAGLLPQTLKRGVLSEDALWNLLSARRELNAQMQQLLCLGEESR